MQFTDKYMQICMDSMEKVTKQNTNIEIREILISNYDLFEKLNVI